MSVHGEHTKLRCGKPAQCQRLGHETSARKQPSKLEHPQLGAEVWVVPPATACRRVPRPPKQTLREAPGFTPRHCGLCSRTPWHTTTLLK